MSPASPKFSGSPPTYADAVAASDPTSTAPSSSAAGFAYPVPTQSHQHANFGPTPLTTAQPLLPYAYYDSRETADARARWRFAGAFLWAMLFYTLMGFIIGAEVLGDDAPGRLLFLKRWIHGGERA